MIEQLNVFDHGGSFGHILGRTSRAMLNTLQKHFTKAGHAITVEQWTLLINIRRSSGRFQQQIAGQVYLDKGTVTRLAVGLEKKKLIRRVSDADDRRQKRMVITRKGLRLLEALKPIVLAVQQQVLQGTEKEKLQACQEVLLTMYRNILKQ